MLGAYVSLCPKGPLPLALPPHVMHCVDPPGELLDLCATPQPSVIGEPLRCALLPDWACQGRYAGHEESIGVGVPWWPDSCAVAVGLRAGP